MKRCFNTYGLKFYEDEQKVGSYHLEYYSDEMPSPSEAKFNLSPGMWEPQSTRCKLTISYECLSYKYDQRKEVVDFANAISSRLSWKHEIIWFTEDSNKTIWKNKEK